MHRLKLPDALNEINRLENRWMNRIAVKLNLWMERSSLLRQIFYYYYLYIIILFFTYITL